MSISVLVVTNRVVTYNGSRIEKRVKLEKTLSDGTNGPYLNLTEQEGYYVWEQLNHLVEQGEIKNG